MNSTLRPPWVDDPCFSPSGEHQPDGQGRCTFPGCDTLFPEQMMAQPPAPATNDDTEGDYWRDVRPAMQQASQEKRASNRETSAKLLQDNGIAFESHNAGAHLIVRHRGLVVDFWPGTGLWLSRKDQTKRRGVHGLLTYIRRNAP